jgi:cellulose synthase/poly-beta-1,6-N-acetylglucosamine synthase-like glycosyltransferase
VLLAMLLFRPPDLTRFYELDRFTGLYHLSGFDVFILIPYLAILTVLAFYGMHRYHLVFLYLKNKHRKTVPPGTFESLPKVTIQLPIYNEMYVVERLVDAACRIRYPKDLLEIQILDDSTDGTNEIAAECAERMKSEGFDIHHIRRTNRMGFKAGALENGLKTATGKFIAIFDADFIPAPNFLEDVIQHFTDPKVGMIQVRWGHINREYSLLTQVESVVLDGHFVIEHAGRHLSGRFFNFNGTAGIWRREAIETAGGWQHDTLTEDTDLSYRAQMIGWNFLYLPDIVCPAELPVEMNAFKTQQFRWAKGLVQTGMKLLPRILRSDLPLKIKIEAFFHLSANISYPLMIVLSLLMLPAMIVRFNQGWFQMLYIDLPLFMVSTFSISSFYLVSQKELFPRTWPRALLYLPFLMALGIGLTITNTRAVLEALIGKQTAFARTPKYRVVSKIDKAKAAKYRKRLGWVPWIELLIGSYFALAIYYAVDNDNLLTVPFLALFVLGYWYTGLMSLLQGRFSGLSLTGDHTKPFPVGV